MKKLILGFIVISVVIFFTCKKVSIPFEDEAEVATQEISTFNESVDSSEPAVQMASLPDPEGIPILVGIDKSPTHWWVKDPTDPTPFVNMVYVFRNLYIRSPYDLGMWEYTSLPSNPTPQWVKVDSGPGLTLIWARNQDTLRLVLLPTKDQLVQGHLQVLEGSLYFVKNGDTLLFLDFVNRTDTLNLFYGLSFGTSGESSFYVDYYENYDGQGNSMIHATVYPDTTEDTLGITSYLYSDSTRKVQVRFRRLGVNFLIDARISRPLYDSTAYLYYRRFSGDFYANNTDIGDVIGVQYKTEENTHRNYCVIKLKSGKELRLW